MISDILKMGDPRLLRVAQPVGDIHDPDLATIIADMAETMHAAAGVGLAAPQIGVDLRLMIFGFDANPRYPDAAPVPATVLINPWLDVLDEETEDGWEGCLSVPGLRGLVPRARHIRYGGRLQDGTAFTRDAEGFHARVFQHELDHLNGVLYPQRITDMTKFGFAEALFSSRAILRRLGAADCCSRTRAVQFIDDEPEAWKRHSCFWRSDQWSPGLL